MAIIDEIVADLEKHIEHLLEEGVTHIEIPGMPGRRAPEKNEAQPHDQPQALPYPGKANVPAHEKRFDNGAPISSVIDIPPGTQPQKAGFMETGGLAEIAREVAACKKCDLHRTRTNTVPGHGCLNPGIMFIGEAPGADEDAAGLPFVGAAGKLLTRLITKLGYTRDQVFIANILKCRPPGNRNPLPDEMEACMPYLRRQISVVKPACIVALGAISAKTLTGMHDTSISRLRGRWFSFENIDLMPTYHPAYLLRGPKTAWFQVWDDMLKVMARLGRELPSEKEGKK